MNLDSSLSRFVVLGYTPSNQNSLYFGTEGLYEKDEYIHLARCTVYNIFFYEYTYMCVGYLLYI